MDVGRRETEEVSYLNSAHHAIKFTSKWSTEEIEFLNVRVMKGCGQLETGLFVKATDSHQYLRYSS